MRGLLYERTSEIDLLVVYYVGRRHSQLAISITNFYVYCFHMFYILRLRFKLTYVNIHLNDAPRSVLYFCRQLVR